MNQILFLLVFSALTVIYLLVGLYASRYVKTTTDYFLAGRNLGIGSVTFTLIATQLGGGILLGTSSKAYMLGMYGIMYTLGICIGFLILGLGFAAKLRDAGINTVAEIFQTKYNSQTLKKIASLLSIITLSGILVAQVVASRELLHGVGIFNQPIFIAFWAFLIAYTMLGGLYAVVLTDIVQVILIILVFGWLWISALAQEPFSFFTFKNLRATQELFTTHSFQIKEILPTLVMPALFALIEQDLAQRFFSSRNRSVAAISALCASLFLILFSLIPIYFGAKARILNLAIMGDASPLLIMLENSVSELGFVLAICGIIAAITSTSDSLLCAISSHIMQDFDISFTKSKLLLSKYVTLFVGLGAFVASYIVPSRIIDIIVGSYEISISCLFVSFVASFYLKKVYKIAAIASMLSGFLGIFIFKFLFPAIPHGLGALALSALSYVIAHYYVEN